MTIPGNLGIADIHNSAKGRPAIVISAGPSLARNVDLLKGVRDRFVLIAAQTVLKPLLAKGILPHYVCAIDYHKISARFYEGVTREQVEGCHLVALVGCNPAILDAWPGRYRMPGDHMLNQILGREPPKPEESLASAGTVAIVCHRLARHLGCDPVILIGQDLACTDGVYYGKGAAIHNVWSTELNQFNTLEMMEWQRIARNKGSNVKAVDVDGREVYTDVLLQTYQAEFGAEIAKDTKAGLLTIDATEGGLEKQGAGRMTLADALEKFRPDTDLYLNQEKPRFRFRPARLDWLQATAGRV